MSSVFNDLLTASDFDQILVLTHLDLSAAFDTNNHDILMNRMTHCFGIRDIIFESYLKQREQVVSVCRCESDPSLLSYGVPQGSVLGPILFILYTKPLSGVTDRH